MHIDGIRTRGLVKLAIGAAAFAAAFWYVMRHGAEPIGGPRTSHFAAIAVGATGALALVGLLEVCTGVSFTQFAKRWDGLAGWQRGVYGALIVVLALAAVGGIFLGLAYFGVI